MKKFNLSPVAMLVLATASYSTFATSQTEFDRQGAMQDRIEPVQIRGVMSAKRIADEYIVTFKPSVKGQSVVNMAAKFNQQNVLKSKGDTSKIRVSPSQRFMAGKFSQSQLLQLSLDPKVAAIEVNQVVESADMGASSAKNMAAPWALDRIDQPQLPLDNSYSPVQKGAGTHVYVIDSGIKLSHSEFGGRAYWGYTAEGLPGGDLDNSGHGTHLAGIVGSNSYGVAPETTLHAVKVLNTGNTASLFETLWGIDYVNFEGTWPAVALLGVSIEDVNSFAFDDSLIYAKEASVAYAVPSGDNSANACTTLTQSEHVMTVAASTSNDDASIYSSSGECVDIYAPGLYVKSTWHTSDTANNTISHSPVAAAHVAGAMAQVRSNDAFCTPQEVYAKVLSHSADGVLNNVPANTPNKLLNVPTGAGGYGDCALPLVEDHNFYRHYDEFVAHTGASAMTGFEDGLLADQWLNQDYSDGVSVTDYHGFKFDSTTAQFELADSAIKFTFDEPTESFGFSIEKSAVIPGPSLFVVVKTAQNNQYVFRGGERDFYGFSSNELISSVALYSLKDGYKVGNFLR